MIRILNSDSYKRDIGKMVRSKTLSENIMICMEECGELSQAASKAYRCDADGGSVEQHEEMISHLAEEIADVLICIDMLKKMYVVSDADVEVMIRKKMDRNMNRLQESGGRGGQWANEEVLNPGC